MEPKGPPDSTTPTTSFLRCWTLSSVASADAGVLAPEWIGTQLLLFAVNLALTLALAALLHRYIEQPSIALGRKTIDWMDTQRHAWRARLGLQKP